MRNYAKDALKSVLREERREKQLRDGEAVNQLLAEGVKLPGVREESKPTRNDFYSIVEELLSELLTQEERDVIRGLFYDGLDGTEVATWLGMSKSWVSKTQDRAIRKLREGARRAGVLTFDNPAL